VKRTRRRRLQLVGAAIVLLVLAAACEAVPGDFTGDRKADLVYIHYEPTDVHRVPSYLEQGQTTPLFVGQADDLPVPGDYDGDGKWEPAVLRGRTWISSALADPMVYDPAGMPVGPPGTPLGMPAPPPTLLPVPGDYDGTGKTVPAYYDQVDATWWIMGHSSRVRFGIPPTTGGIQGYDVPVPADYDGDGKTDIAIYRPSDGSFHYRSSKTGSAVTAPAPLVTAGDPAVIPIPADYDKVGHAEGARTEQNGGNWYVAGHATPVATFAINGAVDPYLPAPADYDGDGKTDAAIMDNANGNLWLTGQPQPPVAGTISYADQPTVLPYAIVVNVVRLVFDWICMQHPGNYAPGTC
jgi:hypothetical protein